MRHLLRMQRHVHRTGAQHRWVEIKAEPMSQAGHKRPILGVRAMSASTRRVEPVDATLYLRGKKMELGR